MAIQKATASMAALAKVLPSTMVASKSCGSASNRLTTPPRSRLPLGQLPRLPFAQGKERGLREREKEAGSGKYQDHHYSDERRGRHDLSMREGRARRQKAI